MHVYVHLDELVLNIPEAMPHHSRSIYIHNKWHMHSGVRVDGWTKYCIFFYITFCSCFFFFLYILACTTAHISYDIVIVIMILLLLLLLWVSLSCSSISTSHEIVHVRYIFTFLLACLFLSSDTRISMREYILLLLYSKKPIV